MDGFNALSLAMEVANDVVAFDAHNIHLLQDRTLGNPSLIWHYDTRPCYAGHEYDRAVTNLSVLVDQFQSNESARVHGFHRKGKLNHVTELRYQGVLKGYMCVARTDTRILFSFTDAEDVPTTVEG